MKTIWRSSVIFISIFIFLLSPGYAAEVPISLKIIDVIGNTSSISSERGAGLNYLVPKNYKIARINLTVVQTLRSVLSTSNLKSLPLFGYFFSSSHAFAEQK